MISFQGEDCKIALARENVRSWSVHDGMRTFVVPELFMETVAFELERLHGAIVRNRQSWSFNLDFLVQSSWY